MTEKERVTVDLDAECYYLDGEFWESWDHYGEEMADTINKLLNEQDKKIQKWKRKAEENEQLKNEVYDWKASAEDYLKLGQSLKKENEQLKKELFECEKEYIIETYHDNAIRRDEKIQSLKEEFKARFGDVE